MPDDYDLTGDGADPIDPPIGGDLTGDDAEGIDDALDGALTALAPTPIAPPIGGELTDAAAIPPEQDNTHSSLVSMPSTFTPAFVELDGGGQSLSTLSANQADAAAGRLVQGTVGGELKTYQVRAGADAQALPGIVRPANFHAVNNAVVFVSC